MKKRCNVRRGSNTPSRHRSTAALGVSSVSKSVWLVVVQLVQLVQLCLLVLLLFLIFLLLTIVAVLLVLARVPYFPIHKLSVELMLNSC